MRHPLLVIILLLLTEFNCVTQNHPVRPIKIIAHRGVHLQAPENSLAAIEVAIQLRLDFVELDVRTTVDSHLVIMHDKSIDRMTPGAGLVSELTLAELQQSRLISKNRPESAVEKIPLLSEALQLMQGKIGIYVDLKDASPQKLLAELKKFQMLDEAVIYAGLAQLQEIKKLNLQVKIMPEVDSEEDLNRVIELLDPQVVAMSWRGFSEELVEKIHQTGRQVYLDILGAGDNPPGVRRTIAAGVDAIQTDDPKMVLRTIGE